MHGMDTGFGIEMLEKTIKGTRKLLRELIAQRELDMICYRCWKRGHTIAGCTSEPTVCNDCKQNHHTFACREMSRPRLRNRDENRILADRFRARMKPFRKSSTKNKQTTASCAIVSGETNIKVKSSAYMDYIEDEEFDLLMDDRDHHINCTSAIVSGETNTKTTSSAYCWPDIPDLGHNSHSARF